MRTLSSTVSRTFIGLGVAYFCATQLVGYTQTGGPLGSTVVLPSTPANVLAGNYTHQPITTVESAPPVVMLNMTRDHQLFYKAYNDYSDLDNDGAPETTYKHSINYYGYFDTAKCYTYSSTNGRFEPASITANKYCNAGTTTGQWSGNFLNWVSMTRFDAVRKLLYGGTRSTDSTTDTVLSRASLPTDGHSFAKYYNGSDIAQLTPFTGVSTSNASTTSSSNLNSNTGSKTYSVTLSALGNPSIGDQIRIVRVSNTNLILEGYVTAVGTGQVTIQVYRSSQTGGTNFNDWRLTNLSSSGISFCNTTWAASGEQSHQDAAATRPPLLRIARGNYELWGANEVWQCYWRDEKHSDGITAAGRNGNLAFFSGLSASNANPRKSASGNDPSRALGSGSNAGNSNTADGEYYVRVQACVTDLLGSERCKQYPSGNLKPIGLLQVYGDDDRIRFGLMTSSYERNVSGGVLRKNVSSFRDETEEATTGQFSTAPASGGIVNTLNRLRMWGYRYDNGTYISADRENCDYQLVGIAAAGTTVGTREVAEGRCASWGNPVGEVYLESLRYLGALSATTAFDSTVRVNTGDSAAKDSSLGLARQTFADPINSTNYCASLNVLTFTASVSSFDNDQMGGLSGLRGAPNVSTFTDAIGTQESIHGNNWFIGNIPSNTNQLCTGKTISNLSAVNGICPEASAIEGSFLIGGASLYARTNRIRNDFSTDAPPADDRTSLKVTSYGIELATNTPNITVTQPGTSRKVSIQPVYRLDRSSTGAGPFGSGAIVDFRIVSQDTANGRGRFYVNWEDSTQGGDYDQDMYGIIEYEFLANDKIKITTDAVSASTANGQGFGYIISGTTKDGPHFHSGILNYDYLDEAASNPISVRDPNNCVLNNAICGSPSPNRIFINANGGCRDCVVDDPPTSVTYDLSGTAAGILKSPLYYMAKYGGFSDNNGNNLPDLQSEWDTRDGNGNPGQDGVPDNYFLVSNPLALETSLRAALDAIIAKTASGTAAAVVSNAQEGQGAVFQALYESSRTDANGRNAKWFGALQSVFIDSEGRLREDGNANQTLDEGNFAADPAFDLFFDASDRTTKLRRFSGDPALNSFSLFPIGQLRTLWNARERLAALSNTEATTQRSFTASAAGGRHILTWIDTNQNGVVDSGEQRDFTASGFGGAIGSGTDLWGLLNVTSTDAASRLIRYIRGEDQSGLRSRTLDYDGNGTLETLRLGDIVHSTPTPVGRPGEGYQLSYGDRSYATYVQRWRNRRSVIYAGANDGLLHAFNAGFYDSASKSFRTHSGNGETQHPLGSELWAYAPYNLMPHLRWLAENDYGHIYYVDGKPRAFDARIFTPEAACSSSATASGCIHPSGWGTVLVVGMRFGGREISLPSKVAGVAAPGFGGYSNLPNQVTTRSAYLVFDVTNPEAAPQLLGEITHPNLGHSTSQPALVITSRRDNCAYGTGTPNRCNGVANSSTTDITTRAADERWMLVFGNGPDEAVNAASTQSARLFAWNLKTKSFDDGNASDGYTPIAVNDTTAFIGDVSVVDWDTDFRTDTLYFGTVKGRASGTGSNAPSGSLFKIDAGAITTAGDGTRTFEESGNPSAWQTPQKVLDGIGPIVNSPSATVDERGTRWLFGGTGRYYANGLGDNNDKLSTNQQKIFGVVDRRPTSLTTVPSAYTACPRQAEEDNIFDGTLPRTLSGLVNSTNAVVRRDGSISGVTALTNTDLPDCLIPQANTSALRTAERSVDDEEKLVRAARLKKGWVVNLNTPASAPAERMASRTALFGDILFSTPFTPSTTLCQGEGNSRLLGLFYKTGAAKSGLLTFGNTVAAATPDGTTVTTTIDTNGDTLTTTVITTTATQTVTNPDGSSGTSSTTTVITIVTRTPAAGGPAIEVSRSVESFSNDVATSSINLGQGLAAGVALHLGSNDNLSFTRVTAITQSSNASTRGQAANVSGQARSGEVDWRDSRRGR